MRFLFVLLVMTTFGCSTHKSLQQQKPPALQLAEASTQKENVAGVLKTDFNQQLEIERAHWHVELAKVLTRDQLEKALVELQAFSATMEKTSDDLSATDVINQRIAMYFEKVFTEQELANLASLLTSKEWQKYQIVLQQMSLAPDTLGLRGDFNKVLERERDLMGMRIFGESAVDSTVENSP